MRRWILAAAAGLIVLLGLQTPAHAHAALLRSTPAAGSVVQEAPTEVVLTFSEPVSPVNDKIRVIGPDGKRVDDGKPVADGPALKIKLKDGLARGTYLVSFRVISADSHPVPGGFTFSFGQTSATPVGEITPEPGNTVRNLIGVAKYLSYAGVALLTGAVFALTLLWPARLQRRGAKRVMWAGFGLVAFATAAGLYLQVPYTNGTGLFDVDSSSFQDVMASRYGIALLVRLGVLAVAAIMVRPLINGTSTVVDQVLVVIVATIGALTWPLAGHPAGSPVPAVSVVADAVHLGGIAIWLGGLVMLFAFLLRQTEDHEQAAILPVWSRWAGLAISAVILAGVVGALIEVGTFAALFGTTYGILMLVKVGLVALILGAAAMARKFVQSGQGVKVRKFVTIELAVAALVLGVTAALTQTTPARTAEAIAQTPPAPAIYTVTLDSSLYKLTVEIDPAQRGNNLVHTYAYDKNNQPLKVVEWKVTAALPSAGVEPIDVPMLRINDNHASGAITLPTAGGWVFSFTARISDFDQDTVSTTVPVK